MASQALYRRWRSKTFAEIIGQDHVTQTLLNALRAGRMAHAYLFSGPRGTGKTTTARVLAKAVNCLDPQDGEPCNRCRICCSLNESRSLDLIEIDGASNTSVDDVRDLRDKISFLPNECRFKVYVIDEVHMLSVSAFNALLKTLEEPPPHAIFILATTEPHRIPLTVLSRCQRFDFRRIPLSKLKQKLELICTQEGIHIQPAALDAIGRHATGSFRDAESLLDQLVSYGTEEISVEDVRRVIGAAPEEIVVGIMAALICGDVGTGLRCINEALDSGVEARQLTHEILEYVRGLLLLKNGGASLLSTTPEQLKDMSEQAERISLSRLLQTARLFNGASNLLKTGIHAQLPLELAFVEAALAGGSSAQDTENVHRTPPTSAASHTAAAEGVDAGSELNDGAPTALAPIPATPVVDTAVESLPPDTGSSGVEADEKPAQSTTVGAGSEGMTLEWLKENWGTLLQATRPRNRAVEALLKGCEPLAVRDDLVTLGFYHAFHKERMGDDKNRVVVEGALADVTGGTYRVKCVMYKGNRQQREHETESERREALLKNPVVNEAIERYGAKVIDVQ